MRRKSKLVFKILAIVFSSLAIFYGFFAAGAVLVSESEATKKNTSVSVDSSLNEKNVLFVSAKGMDDPIFAQQKKGILSVFLSNGIFLDEILLDPYSCDDPVWEEHFVGLHKKRIESHPEYDAVIVGDDVSLSFVEKHQEELFKDIPIVFLGVTNVAHAQRAVENPMITGSLSVHCLEEIINIAILQNPDAKYVTAIVDGTDMDVGEISQFYSLSTLYPDYIFSSIKTNSFTHDELKMKLASIDRSTILVYLSGVEDLEGRKYTIQDMVHTVVSKSQVPVYTDVPETIGYGFAGGCVMDGETMGKRSAETLISIFGGVPVSEFPLYTKSSFNYCFDYSVCKKLGLDISVLPKNTVWVNGNRNFWNSNNRKIVVALFHILLGGIILVVMMAVMTFRSRIILKELKSSRKQLEYMVGHDFLTGLPKIQSAHQVISELICGGTRFAVVKINITNFKGINDAYTHACGDAVLRKIGSLLIELDDSEYFVARDGSEFMVIYRVGYLSEVSTHFEHLRTTFMDIPFSYNGVSFDINTKMGIFNVPVESTLSDDEVISAVNYALYVAKSGGKYKYVFFTSEMQEKIRNTKEVVKILDDACENDGFEPFFQPQIDVESGEIFGYESLCRLKNYTISPALFIPVAESNGYITKIGRIMTEKVVQQMAVMRDEGMKLRQFAINYSAGQIVDTGYVSFLKSLLEKYDIPPRMIEIEITESLYLGKDQDSANLFRQLEELGVSLALDDFGTGYSSISYLTYVPVGVVKIDKTMVDIYLHDGKDVLIKNIINMVHSLGMKLIAEGIEEEWQYQKLKKFDCDVIQGYYFSKPIRGSEIKKFSV